MSFDTQPREIDSESDSEQLGPIVRAPAAQQHGYDVSLLERLLQNGPLSGPEVVNKRVFKLRKNYRSLKPILDLYNQFYNNKLEACASDARERHRGGVFEDPTIDRSEWRETSKGMLHWDQLPRHQGLPVPVIFHHVVGTEDQGINSPSFKNEHEIKVIEEYVGSLLQFKVDYDDIGVIAPYVLQRREISKRPSGDAQLSAARVAPDGVLLH